jgi:chemotaxis protein CheX
MRAEYINPFISSLVRIFQQMLSCEAKRGAPFIPAANQRRHAISGTIGLSGMAVGTVVVNLPRSVALKAAKTMLMTDTDPAEADLIDAIGELTNMIAGAAKAQLEECELAVSLPNVITGENHAIHFPSNVAPICVPFETPWGPVVLEVGLTAVTAAVGG